MRVNLFRGWSRGREADANVVRLCQARTGLDMLCGNPARPGRNLCSFHDTFVGPWSRPDKHFKNFR